MTIDDPRFLRQFSRRFCRRSVTGLANARVLAGRTIEVHDYESDIEIRVVDAQGILIGLLWSENAVWIVDEHTLAGILADEYDEDELAECVRLFLRRHRINKSIKKDSAA